MKPAVANRGFFILTPSMDYSVRELSGLVRVFPLVFLLAACGSPPREMQSKLQEIGKADMDVILKELPEKARREAVLPNPHFVVNEYQEFQGDTARVFQAYASLVFFYLDPSLDLCQTRKYRYRRSARVWERFEVVLQHIPPKYASEASGDSSPEDTAEKP